MSGCPWLDQERRYPIADPTHVDGTSVADLALHEQLASLGSTQIVAGKFSTPPGAELSGEVPQQRFQQIRSRVWVSDGGADMIAYHEGHSHGVLSIEFRTDGGLRSGMLPERGLDIGPAEFQGMSLAWMSPKTLPGPWYYESASGAPYSFVRFALGGLFNTGGLVTMGPVMTIPTDQYGYAQRPTDTCGILGRVSMTPADRVSFGETRNDDECLLWAEGTVCEYLAYGEKVSLTRRYTSP